MADLLACYPWLLPVRDRLLASSRQGRMHHALLLSGPRGIGKNRLGRIVAAARLCMTPDAAGAPCGECRSCVLFRSGTHPDYFELLPEKEGGQIAIESVREAIDFIQKTASVNAHKAIFIAPVEALNLASSNALLKVLEEPAGDSSLVLVGEAVHRLPATVLSRCQQVALAIPPVDAVLPWMQAQAAETSPDTLKGWLKACGGAPLRAMASGDETLELGRSVAADLDALAARKTDPMAVAARWARLDVAACLEAMWRYLLDRQRQALLQGTGPAAGLAESLADLVDALRVLDHPHSHPNQQLLLEKLLIACGSRLALE